MLAYLEQSIGYVKIFKVDVYVNISVMFCIDCSESVNMLCTPLDILASIGRGSS